MNLVDADVPNPQRDLLKQRYANELGGQIDLRYIELPQ